MPSDSQDNNTTTATIITTTTNPSSIQHGRASIPPGTSPATSLFQRRNSLAATAAPSPIFTSPAGNVESHHRRRVSVSASLGLTGSPGNPSFIFRRSSMSTNSNSDSIDETAVEDDERNSPSTPFTARRMSFSTQALRGLRGNVSAGSPVTTGTAPSLPGILCAPATGCMAARRHSVSNHLDGPPPSGGGSIAELAQAARRHGRSSGVAFHEQLSYRTLSDMRGNFLDQGAFDWSEQLRARARSSVNGIRPVFGTSPPRELRAAQPPTNPKPVEMPTPPTQPVRPKQDTRPKPDAYQERILKGDFYMD